MFRRHKIASFCILAYYLWLVFLYYNYYEPGGIIRSTFLIIFFGTVAFIVRAISTKDQERKDFLKFLGLIYLPFILLILALIIYLLCGGKIFSKLPM